LLDHPPHCTVSFTSHALLPLLCATPAAHVRDGF